MPILVIGLSHHTAPVSVREQFALGDAVIPAALERLRQAGLAEEAVVLSTCNRVELYAATSVDAASAIPALQRFLLESRAVREPPGNFLYAKSEPHSLEHLFRVACGLDSMILGETEILGQLKHAYEIALRHHFTGRRLNKAFQRAFSVAKQIRTETQIQRGSISVASVAVELAERIFTSLPDHQVMVIGAGDTSEKTARALLSRGARGLLVTNRTYATGAALAQTLGGRVIPFETWIEACGQVDIIISSTSAPHYLLDRPRLEPLMRLRKNDPLLLVDIAVPRNLDPEVNFMDNVFLYNIDDLKTIADDYLRQRQQEIALCERIIRDKVAGLLHGPPRPSLPPNAGLACET